MPATVASALSNFMFRRTAERVETEEPQTSTGTTSNTYAYDVELGSDSENNSITEEHNFEDEDNLEEGHFVGSATTAATPPRTNNNTTSGNVNVDDIATQEGIAATVAASLALDPTGTVLPLSSTAATSVTTTIAAAATTTTPLTTTTTRNAVSLRALEEERLALQRRSGSCVLLAGFFLFQLWIQAVSSGDFGLLLLCLVFTSWTARFVRYTREQEDEMTQQIQTWNEPGGGGSTDTSEDAGSSALDDARRLRRMSFQSQLALAIIQSQIQLMETGGHGHPDGGTARGDGLTEDDKQRWDRFSFTSTADLVDRGLFNDTAKEVSLGTEKDQTHDAAPECTICLCEYEPGDTMVALPCKHVFHDDCITAWTAHNTRCPLCNTELSAAASRTTA